MLGPHFHRLDAAGAKNAAPRMDVGGEWWDFRDPIIIIMIIMIITIIIIIIIIRVIIIAGGWFVTFSLFHIFDIIIPID